MADALAQISHSKVAEIEHCQLAGLSSAFWPFPKISEAAAELNVDKDHKVSSHQTYFTVTALGGVKAL